MSMNRDIEQLTKCLEPIPVAGLTKREYFAAMAMQGIIHKNLNYDELKEIIEEPMSSLCFDVVARLSVSYANALIKALGEK